MPHNTFTLQNCNTKLGTIISIGHFNTLKVSFIVQVAAPSGGEKQKLRLALIVPNIDI